MKDEGLANGSQDIHQSLVTTQIKRGTFRLRNGKQVPVYITFSMNN